MRLDVCRTYQRCHRSRVGYPPIRLGSALNRLFFITYCFCRSNNSSSQNFFVFDSCTPELHSILEWHFLCPMCTHWHLPDFDAVDMVFLKLDVIFVSTRTRGIDPYQICYNRLSISWDTGDYIARMQNFDMHITKLQAFYSEKSMTFSISSVLLGDCKINISIDCANSPKCPCTVLLKYTEL